MANAPAPHDLLTLEPVQAAAAPGAAAYGQYCAVCHQTNGQGTPGVFPPLAGVAVVTGDPHYLARVVLYGLQGRIVVSGQAYDAAMAGLAKNMTDAQIAQVLTYIRSSWGNSASPVTEDVVKAERDVPGTPQDNGAKYPK
jgi:mono/diheme cytochrome c family protein